jgi:hypothetical protein
MKDQLGRTPTQAHRAATDLPQFIAELEEKVRRAVETTHGAAIAKREALDDLEGLTAILTGSLPTGESKQFLSDVDLPGCQASLARLQAVLVECVSASVQEAQGSTPLADSGWGRFLNGMPEPALEGHPQ